MHHRRRREEIRHRDSEPGTLGLHQDRHLEGIEALAQGAEDIDAVLAALSAVSYYFPYTAERALRMLRDLYTEGFTAFA
jgi:hypothetical protein